VFGCEQTALKARSKKAFRPKFKRFPFERSPLEVFSKLYTHFNNAYILESVEGPKKLAQYSFIGFDPRLTIQIKNGEVTIQNKRTSEEIIEKTVDPLQVVKKIVGAPRPGHRCG